MAFQTSELTNRPYQEPFVCTSAWRSKEKKPWHHITSSTLACMRSVIYYLIFPTWTVHSRDLINDRSMNASSWSPAEPFPLFNRHPEQRRGEDTRRQGWRRMEGLLWRDAPGDRGRVRHALRSGIHLSSHDVSCRNHIGVTHWLM